MLHVEGSNEPISDLGLVPEANRCDSHVCPSQLGPPAVFSVVCSRVKKCNEMVLGCWAVIPEKSSTLGNLPRAVTS